MRTKRLQRNAQQTSAFPQFLAQITTHYLTLKTTSAEQTFQDKCRTKTNLLQKSE